MAMPAKTPTEESSPYAVNKALFEEAAAIKEKMKMVENRLVKMDEHRNEVSEAVYFKVKTDYETQLDSVKQSFSEKCKDVEKELATLYEAQQEQETHLAGHQEVLEEARFRHTLGEFNDKKFKDLEGSQNKEIKKYGDLLEIIKSSIKQYEEILGYSYQQHFRVEVPRTSKVAAAPVTAMPAPEKKSGAFGFRSRCKKRRGSDRRRHRAHSRENGIPSPCFPSRGRNGQNRLPSGRYGGRENRPRF